MLDDYTLHRITEHICNINKWQCMSMISVCWIEVGFVRTWLVCCHRLGTQLEYSVFFMPRRAMVCEKVFQEEGIFADVTLSEYPLDFIPFDSDILSLELDTAYKVN